MPVDAFTIRSFQARDEPVVVALWRAAFPGDPAWNEPATVIRRKLSVQADLFFVGVIDGKIVAAVMAGFDGFRGWIYHLAVDPAHQRKGCGGAMMREAEARLRRLGCTKVNLQVRRSNQEVVAFYEAIGFGVEDRISMGKRLA
jgi:ribosomal protein S18 acetylase RimI-like enzyme